MKKKKKLRDDKYGRYGALFIIPFFIVFAIFTVYPIAYSIRLSFTRWGGSGDPLFIGWDNYTRLIADAEFYKAIANTLLIWLPNIVAQLGIGLLLAVLLTNRKIPGAGFFRAAFYLPNLITMVSIGALFFNIIDWNSGSLNNMLVAIGISAADDKINWLGDVNFLRGSISFTLTWMWFGYTMIIFMAGIKSISEEIFEAALVDGANGWQTFKSITLPLLRPTMVYQVVTSVIGGLSMFDIPYMIAGPAGGTENGATTVVMYLYKMGFANPGPGYGYAATMGIGLLIITSVFVLISFKLIYKEASAD